MIFSSFAEVWLSRLIYQNGAALWTFLAFYEYCLSMINALQYTETLSETSATTFGGIILSIFLFSFAIIESFFTDDYTSYTLMHWILYLAFAISLMCFDLTTSRYQPLPSVPWLPHLVVYFIFCSSLHRLFVFIRAYRHRSIPRFDRTKVYTLLDRPRRF